MQIGSFVYFFFSYYFSVIIVFASLLPALHFIFIPFQLLFIAFNSISLFLSFVFLILILSLLNGGICICMQDMHTLKTTSICNRGNRFESRSHTHTHIRLNTFGSHNPFSCIQFLLSVNR